MTCNGRGGENVQQRIRTGVFRCVLHVLVGGQLAAASISPGYAEVAKVHFELVERLVGEDGGSGTLFYKGRHNMRLTIRGIRSTGSVRGVDLIGTVSNLSVPENIEGQYHAENGTSAIMGSLSPVRLQNEKGVVLTLHATRASAGLLLDLSGVTIGLTGVR